MSNTQKLNSKMRFCAFIREDSWYPLEIPEAAIKDNAECNPGTLRVEDVLTGEVLWKKPAPTEPRNQRGGEQDL